MTSSASAYTPRTIYKGKRQSAATAFIRPVEGRRNLTILTDRTADRVLFKGRRAVGVEVRRNGAAETIQAAREVILCGGAMSTPGILERSGVGDAARLEALGVPVVHDLPEVGEGLIEHRGIVMQWKLNAPAVPEPRVLGTAGCLNRRRSTI